MICLGCARETTADEVPQLPMLLKGQFCGICAARLGFVPPVEVDRMLEDVLDDVDEEDDSDEDDDSSSD